VLQSKLFSYLTTQKVCLFFIILHDIRYQVLIYDISIRELGPYLVPDFLFESWHGAPPLSCCEHRWTYLSL
jgi:hypothetical protein